jgi:hypothetical protein
MPGALGERFSAAEREGRTLVICAISDSSRPHSEQTAVCMALYVRQCPQATRRLLKRMPSFAF